MSKARAIDIQTRQRRYFRRLCRQKPELWRTVAGYYAEIAQTRWLEEVWPELKRVERDKRMKGQ